jgi:hypothetical protein
MKNFLKRFVFIVVAAEFAYLIIINTVLYLPITQDLVNKIRPEKFQVTWERAWSLYPFRLNAEGIAANGQARTQQWEAYATSGAASISLLPLIFKDVYLSDVEAENIDYRQRPRLKPDRDYSKTLPYFPSITGREVVPVDTSELPKKRPWKIHVNDIAATGEHRFWVFNLQGTGSGSALGNLYTETRGGTFSLDVTDLDLNLGPAFLNGDAEIFEGGTVQGVLGFSPLTRRDNKGRRMLKFSYVDTQLDLTVGSFNFLKIFTAGLGNLDISGAGQLTGHLAVRDGYVRAGTELSATTTNLGVAIRDIDISGVGSVFIQTPADADMPLKLDIHYDTLAATRMEESDPFLRGTALQLSYTGSNFILPDPDMSLKELWSDEAARQRRADNTFDLAIDDAKVIDMSAFNYYLPSDTAFSFAGGETALNARVSLTEDTISGTIDLDSAAMKVQVDDQSFEADLDADIVIQSGVPRDLKANISGSSLRLFNVRVDGNEESFDGDYWSTSLTFTDAEGTFIKPIDVNANAVLTVSDTRPLVTFFDNRNKPPKWLSNMMAVKNLEGEAELEVSDGAIRIPLAYVDSEKAEVGVKGVIANGERNGLVFARFKKFSTLLKRFDGKRDVDIIKPRAKFDRYQISDAEAPLDTQAGSP